MIERVKVCSTDSIIWKFIPKGDNSWKEAVFVIQASTRDKICKSSLVCHLVCK